jgi:predicted ATPase
MLSWFADEGQEAAPVSAARERLRELFDDEPDGYLRFRRSLLRDAAYEGLPYKVRRRLHSIVAARLESEALYPEDDAGILCLHYLEATEYEAAWRYARIAAARATNAYAYAEAAGFYARALQAGRRLPSLSSNELALIYEALGDAWSLAGDFRKALEAYTTGRRFSGKDALKDGGLILKQARMEAKLGRHVNALRLATRARKALQPLDSLEARRLMAQTTASYATMLQVQGRTGEAIERANEAVSEAEAAD